MLALGLDEESGILDFLLSHDVLVIYRFSNGTEARDDARVDFPGRRDLAGGQRATTSGLGVAYRFAQLSQEPAVESGPL